MKAKPRMLAQKRIQKALDTITSYGGIDGGHHKQWVLDQVVQALTGTKAGYGKWVKEFQDGEDGTRNIPLGRRHRSIMKNKTRMLAPSECNTERKVLWLNSEGTSTPRSWIEVDGPHVCIVNQPLGEMSTESIAITIADMRKFARWFLRKQRCK